MKIRFWILVAVVLVMVESTWAEADNGQARNSSRARRSGARSVKSVEINSGFVIYKGRYIRPPYLIKSQRGRIYINKVEVPYLPQAPFFRRNIGMRYFDRTLLNQTLEQIEQNLRRDAMLICTHTGLTVYSPLQQAIPILDVLLSDQTQDEKLQMLMEIGPSWIPSDQWALMVEKFKAHAELSERVLALKQQRATLDEDDTDEELPMSFLSGITITGFILAVWAFGTLLSCRPPAITGEQTNDSAKGYYRQVLWLIVLIVVLNIYDLICTLFAHGVGSLWELNPFAGDLIENTPMIVTFKISLTVGAAIMLMLGRRLKLAQIGVWWISVFYTVLIIRWTIFNSIFL